MDIETIFDQYLFVQKCNENSFPRGLLVCRNLDLSGCSSLTALPDGLEVGGWLDLQDCSSLMTLPKGLQVGGWLRLSGCVSLTALPDGLQVGNIIHVDQRLLDQYPFRSIPKILHLPFQEDMKQLIMERLQNGY